MESIEKITLKICKDAESCAADTVQRARERAESIISEATAKAQRLKSEELEKAEAEARAIISRAASSADILERNILLDTKSVIIDGIYKKAEKRLSEMIGARYLGLLTSSLGRAIEFLLTCEDGEEEASPYFTLTLNERDGKIFARQLFDLALPTVKKYRKELRLSDTHGDFSGGLRLSLGSVTADLTLSSLLKSSAEETEGELYGILFGQQSGETVSND